MDKVWERFGLTRKEWDKLTEEDREKLTGQDWQTKLCKVCGKPVLVLAKVDEIFCMEHSDVR